MKLHAALLGFSLLAASTSSALAVDTVTAGDPQTVLDAFAQMGYGGTLYTLSAGAPQIGATIAGKPVWVDFYQCTEEPNSCEALLIVTEVDADRNITIEQINGWNAQQIYGRAFARDGKIWLDIMLITGAGVPYDVFDRQMYAVERTFSLVDGRL